MDLILVALVREDRATASSIICLSVVARRHQIVLNDAEESAIVIAKSGILLTTRKHAEISACEWELRIKQFKDDSAMRLLLYLSAVESNRNVHKYLSVSWVKFGQLI